jgi:hypothetical protein
MNNYFIRFAVGASHHVYYMWEGGNHIARWAGASVTNMYATRPSRIEKM